MHCSRVMVWGGRVGTTRARVEVLTSVIEHRRHQLSMVLVKEHLSRPDLGVRILTVVALLRKRKCDAVAQRCEPTRHAQIMVQGGRVGTTSARVEAYSCGTLGSTALCFLRERDAAARTSEPVYTVVLQTCTMRMPE